MDRREALKKLGAGGVVVATASLVQSQPAFAYDAPTPVNPPSVGVGGANPASVTIIDGTASCPASANSTSATVLSRSTTVSSSLDPVGGQRVVLPGSGVLPQTTGAPTFNLQRQLLFFVFWINFAFAPGTTLTFNLTTVVRCTYSDGTTRDAQLTNTVTLTYQGGGVWA